jgi:uncharacterized protein YndB with AHSA1/START domain
MTTPDVPHRYELTLEVPGTPEQVWAAIATANGISSWMMPTTMEEREGGTITFSMGPDATSEGRVTGWDPPTRVAYEEPRWAELVGQDPSTVTPLVSEFLVEAKSGGTCVVRVVSSAFGTGADWENEFFEDLSKGWTPMFENLKLYLTHFAGQRVTSMESIVEVPGTPAVLMTALRAEAGVETTGDKVRLHEATGEVTVLSAEHTLVRLTEPVPGFLALFTFQSAEDVTSARLAGHFFADDAARYVAEHQAGWQAWWSELVRAAGER